MFRSVKIKLFLWFFLTFSLILSATGFFIYRELGGIVIESIDNHLHSEIQFIANLLEVEKGKIEVELQEASVGEYTVPYSGHYYQVVSEDDIILVKSPSLADSILPLSPIESLPRNAPRFETSTGPKTQPLRLMSQLFTIQNKPIIIQAAEDLSDSYRIIDSFRSVILLILLGVFLLSGLGGLFIAGMALRPLNVFSKKIGLITEKNLNERVLIEGLDTELKQLAKSFNATLERLEQSFLMQRQFLADASHELRTPTSVIKSYCEVTLKQERKVEEYQSALKVINEVVTKISFLIDKILEVSRLDSQMVMRPEKLDIMDVLKDVYHLMLPLAEKNGITIALHGELKTVVNGDRERLVEMFTNIVDNAIKYNQAGGRVDIELCLINKKDASISIADTGIGMPQEEVDRIFERFYRIDTSRGEIAGSGLGLSIAKAIAEAHHGRIIVQSEIGTGSIFKIYIPLVFQ